MKHADLIDAGLKAHAAAFPGKIADKKSLTQLAMAVCALADQTEGVSYRLMMNEAAGQYGSTYKPKPTCAECGKETA